MRYLYVLPILLVLHTSFGQITDFKNIDFKKADDNAVKFQGEGLENLPILSYNLTHNLETDVEKFRAIYKWVCLNISGDISQHQKVSRKRKKLSNDSNGFLNWNKKHLQIVFKKLLKYKKTVCTGYAYLIKELCFLSNIECEIVDGYGRTLDANVDSLNITNHSWNAVKLNGKWYLCDATWSSGYSLNNFFVTDYNDGYFLTDPVLFSKNHYPIEKKWLINEELINSEYVASPLVYGETFEHHLIPIQPGEMVLSTTTNKKISFSFKSRKYNPENNISLIYLNRNQEKRFEINDLKYTSDIISFSAAIKHKGVYDAHLKINNDIVATYVIKVTKG